MYAANHDPAHVWTQGMCTECANSKFVEVSQQDFVPVSNRYSRRCCFGPWHLLPVASWVPGVVQVMQLV